MLDRLNQLYIEARYPGELGLLPEGKPSIEDAQRFRQVAEQVYRDVHNALDQDE
jgi:HEPN domain-containing protein